MYISNALANTRQKQHPTHKTVENSFKLLVPKLYSLNTKESVNLKVKGRSQSSLDVHMITCRRLLKLFLLNDIHHYSSKTTDSLYQLHGHQKRKVEKGQQTAKYLSLFFFPSHYHCNWSILISLQLDSVGIMA